METTPTQEMVAKLIEWMEGSKSFVAQQAPDYIQQYLRMTIVQYWVELAFEILVVLALIGFVVFCIKECGKYEKSYETPTVIQMGSFFPLLIAIFPAVGTYMTVQKLITVYMAPKVFILQHLKELIK